MATGRWLRAAFSTHRSAATVAPDTTRNRRALVVALIPAHNEEEQIEDAILSLRLQELPLDLIVVCADKLHGLHGRAGRAGRRTRVRDGRQHAQEGRRAQPGARNPPAELGDEDAVLVMDVDSALAPTFVAAAAGARSPRRGDVAPGQPPDERACHEAGGSPQHELPAREGSLEVA